MTISREKIQRKSEKLKENRKWREKRVKVKGESEKRKYRENVERENRM